MMRGRRKAAFRPFSADRISMPFKSFALSLAAPFMAFSLLAFSASAPALAQGAERIAAVVNDDVVTGHDLEMRLRLAISSTGLPDNEETRRRVLPQVIRRLIDEKLQMQEAKRLEVEVSDGEIDRQIAQIESRNGMPPGALLPMLRQQGVNPEALRAQVRAEIAWVSTVSRRLSGSVRVSQDEITAMLDMLKASQGQPEFLASEIFLALDGSTSEDDVRRLVERLVDQIRGGASFPQLAQQFSQDATAAAGGSLGWVTANLMDPDLAAALSAMQPGDLRIVRSLAGFHILSLRDRRIAGGGGEIEFDLAQALFSIPKDADAEIKAKTASRAAEMAASVRSCENFETLGTQLGADRARRVGKVTSSDMAPDLRAAVLPLQAGQVSRPVEGPNVLSVVMVCARKELPPKDLPSRDEIAKRIEGERLDLLARRRLRDLRRSAFIDLRI